MPTRKVTKTDAKVTKIKEKKIVAKKDGVTLNCLTAQTVVPKDASLLDNTYRFARKCGIGNCSIFSSPAPNASAMNENQIRDFSGTELWITERNKAS